jgi:hypothetical protein
MRLITDSRDNADVVVRSPPSRWPAAVVDEPPNNNPGRLGLRAATDRTNTWDNGDNGDGDMAKEEDSTAGAVVWWHQQEESMLLLFNTTVDDE